MSLRVLYAPRNISGQASEYLEAVRRLGLDGEVWSYGATAFGFDATVVLETDRLLADPAYRWEMFDRAVRNFDVFHLQYARSLLNPEGVVLPDLWDVPLLKSLGKRVVMNFRGSDVRSPSRHLEREPDSYFGQSQATTDEDRIRGRVAICRRFCDAMLVSTPGLLDDVPDAVWLPHVIDVAAWQRPPRAERERPVVVHAPSSRATKGSDAIDAALSALEARGVVVYHALSGLDRGQLRAALQDADLVIDSLTIGDHGLISVEAMAAGAIPIANIHPENRSRNPGVPVVQATVHDLTSVVEDLAADPTRRTALRAACEQHVRRRHDRSVIGPQLVELYRQPPRAPDRARPDWPRSDTQERVQRLEARIDELESDLDPLVRGFGPLSSSLPERVTRRLLVRIAELESELRRLDPGHELAQVRGRRSRATAPTSLRDRLKRSPKLHRFVRRARRAVRAAGRG